MRRICGYRRCCSPFRFRDPEPSLRRLCEFAGLEWSSGFEAVVRNASLYDSTDTWREHLSDEDGERVLELLRRTERVAR